MTKRTAAVRPARRLRGDTARGFGPPFCEATGVLRQGEAKMEGKTVCAACVLPDTTPGIEFDDRGICNYCRAHAPVDVSGEEKLRELLDRFRNPAKRYECMVCLSGGRDSTYVLWKIVHDYRMKTLAVTYNSPFMSDRAHENIRLAVGKLGVDHLYWDYPGDVHRQTTKKHLRIWAKHPSSKMIPFVCAHCKSWNFQFYEIAREHRVPLIVFGSNPLETASFKKDGFGGARTYSKLSNLPVLASRALNEIAANPGYLSANWNLIFKMYAGASHSTPYMRWRFGDISAIRIFDYLRWDEKEIEKTVADALGWEKSPDVASAWRFDCRLDYVRRLMYSSTIGVTELRDLFSKMIREGMISREEALERLKREEPISRKVVDQVLAEMGLSLSDLRINIDRNLLVE